MFATLTIATTLALATIPQSKRSTDPIVRGDDGKRLEAEVEKAVPEFWGAVLVAPRGEIVLARGYRLEKTKPKAGADYHFDVGSISKTYTAVAVLQLDQAGKLRLDDPLSKWLTLAPADKSAITIRQLLQHASGFPRSAAGYKADDYQSRDSVLRAILDQPLTRKPGEAFEYSNVNYTLLAAVVELASKQDFEDCVTAKIFEPCKLADTSFAGWRGRKLERGRDTERISGGMRAKVMDYPWGWGKRGVTNVVTSTLDLHKYATALRAGDLLDPAHTEMLFATGPGDYTCGLEIMTGEGGDKRFGHRGSTDGYGAIFSLDRDDGTVIVVLARTPGDADRVYGALSSALTRGR